MARVWEATNARPELFGGRGMVAQGAAWTAAFGAEAAATGGLDHGSSLLDLVKAFEKIPHQKILQAAKKHGLNLSLIRMSFAAYRIHRSICTNGIFSATVQATRGITAGSGFATPELRALLIDLVVAVTTLWPVDAMLYVDDLTLSASGSSAMVANTIAQATDSAVEHF